MYYATYNKCISCLLYIVLHYISLIQTILSVTESHRFNHRGGSQTFTAGEEFHLAPKYLVTLLYTIQAFCQVFIKIIDKIVFLV